MLPQLIFSLPLMSSQQAGDGIYVSVLFGTSVMFGHVCHVLPPAAKPVCARVAVRVTLFQLLLYVSVFI